MALSDGERTFLLDLKSQGIGQEEATERLLAAKKNILSKKSPAVSLALETVESAQEAARRGAITPVPLAAREALTVATRDVSTRVKTGFIEGIEKSKEKAIRRGELRVEEKQKIAALPTQTFQNKADILFERLSNLGKELGTGIGIVSIPFTSVLGEVLEPIIEPVVTGIGRQFINAVEVIHGEDVAEATREIALEKIGKLVNAYEQSSPEAKEVIDNTFSFLDIATLFGGGRVAKKGVEVSAKVAKEAAEIAAKQAGKVGEILIKSGEKKIAQTKELFVRELITPIKTKKIKELEVPRTKESKGLLGERILEPTKLEAQAEKAVLEIPDVSSKKTALQNFNAISEANVNEAKTLESLLKENDFIFPKKELSARLDDVKTILADSPTLVGDAQKTAQKLLNRFSQFVNEEGATASGLLRARKKYDAWVKGQKPKAFDPTKEGAFELANREIRQTVNGFLNEKAINVDVKASLAKQRALFVAMENVGPKAALEASNAFGRMMQRMAETVGIKNKLVQQIATIVGIGGLGAAAAFAPAAAATIGGIFILTKAGKLAFNPKLRVALGKMLKQLDESINKVPGVAEISKLRNSKGNIEGFLNEFSE